MTDIGPGDKVVCVAGHCGAQWHRDDTSILVVGRIYTATGYTPPERFGGDCVGGLHIAEIPIGPMESGFCIDRFRKVQKADDKFIEQVRACRPRTRERVQ